MSIYYDPNDELVIELQKYFCKQKLLEGNSNLFLPYDPIINKIEAIKRNSEFVTCPKCGVEGNRPNMMRWHFDKCKTILKNCKQCDKVIPRQGIKDHQYKEKHYCNRECYMKSKKGKTPILLTDEMKKTIGQKNSKKIMINGIIYKSRTEMSKIYNISGQKFKEWVECGKITYIKAK
jgi:hypothetical protein